MNKEVSDALHMLLHCSLKDTEYNTQINQFNIVYKYINKLEQENKQLKEKSDVLEENNKLLIQQKAQMYEDLDIAYEKIDNAKDFCKRYLSLNLEAFDTNKLLEKILEILGDKE